MPTTTCRDCEVEVSTSALQCPECGAPFPYKETWDGYGYEYKSEATFLGQPLVHISFKYRPNKVPVVAQGWLAIGQFSAGFVNISQFGLGPICLSQFALAGMAISQFCASAVGIAQMGLVYDGWGQMIYKIKDLL